MYNNRLHPKMGHQHDVLGEEVSQFGAGHCVAAVFDHDASAPEGLDVWQRFDKDIGGDMRIDSVTVWLF